jgi:hypothetical protein
LALEHGNQTGQNKPGFQITNNEIKILAECKIIDKGEISSGANF